MSGNEAYFLTIVEQKSLLAAAKELGITQPALSNYLVKLENELNVTLFDRTQSPMKLTKIGELYYDHVKKVKSLENDFFKTLEDIENVNKGDIIIGGASSSNSCLLASATAQFLSKYPSIGIRIVDGVVSEIANKALNDEVDFFITPKRVMQDDFEYLTLTKERTFLCVPTDSKVNKLLKKYEVNKDDLLSGKSISYEPIDGQLLKDERFILLDKTTHVRAVSDVMFKRWQLVPKNPIEISQMMSALELTIAGLGASFVTENVLKRGNFSNLPAIYAFDDDISNRNLYISYKKNRYISAACREYIKILLESFKERG